MTRCMIPVYKRITLLARSRTKGLGGVVATMCILSLPTVFGSAFVYWISGIMISFIALPLVLAATSEELVGSEVAIWLQKPVREVPFALTGFAETLTTTVVLSVLFGAACVAVGLAMGWEPVRPPLVALPVGALAALIVASMAFGAAAWLPRGSRAAVLLLIVLAVFVFDPEVSQPELVREGPVVLARFILFPVPDLLRFGLGLTGDLPLHVRPILAMLAYSAGWIAVGALGIWRSARIGRIGYS